eukprot:scaffold1598_cov100-Skeletonema_dohrnii-CCMP3373.AAC.6
MLLVQAKPVRNGLMNVLAPRSGKRLHGEGRWMVKRLFGVNTLCKSRNFNYLFLHSIKMKTRSDKIERKFLPSSTSPKQGRVHHHDGSHSALSKSSPIGDNHF